MGQQTPYPGPGAPIATLWLQLAEVGSDRQDAPEDPGTPCATPTCRAVTHGDPGQEQWAVAGWDSQRTYWYCAQCASKHVHW
jgi:hypothetical protein